MKLTDSTGAKVGGTPVNAIVSLTNAFIQFMVYTSQTLTSAITGAIGLEKNGAGTLTLTGVCDYTGPTKLNQGQISISSASILSGIISGNGSLEKTGVTTLTLNGQNTYTGGTTLSAGIINCGSNTCFGSGNVNVANAQIVATTNLVFANNFVNNTQIQFRCTGTLRVNGTISGAGILTKTSPQKLTLSGNNTYTGTTTITAGTIEVSKTNGACTATALFSATALSVSFNTPPTTGMTFRFFPGSSQQTYSSVALTGQAAGQTATYNSTNSTLTIL